MGNHVRRRRFWLTVHIGQCKIVDGRISVVKAGHDAVRLRRGNISRLCHAYTVLAGCQPAHGVPRYSRRPRRRASALRRRQRIHHAFDGRSSLSSSIALLDRIASQRSIPFTLAHTRGATEGDSETDRRREKHGRAGGTARATERTQRGRRCQNSVIDDQRRSSRDGQPSSSQSPATERASADDRAASAARVTARYNC